jgi:hypothetical protein
MMLEAPLGPVRIHQARFSHPYGALNLLGAILAFMFLIANSCTRWRGIFKLFLQDGRIFFKSSAPHLLIMTY